jgi:hypothetical protein
MGAAAYVSARTSTIDAVGSCQILLGSPRAARAMYHLPHDAVCRVARHAGFVASRALLVTSHDLRNAVSSELRLFRGEASPYVLAVDALSRRFISPRALEDGVSATMHTALADGSVGVRALLQMHALATSQTAVAADLRALALAPGVTLGVALEHVVHEKAVRALLCGVPTALHVYLMDASGWRRLPNCREGPFVCNPIALRQ